jgi:hypothetical protein
VPTTEIRVQVLPRTSRGKKAPFKSSWFGLPTSGEPVLTYIELPVLHRVGLPVNAPASPPSAAAARLHAGRLLLMAGGDPMAL